MGVLGCQPQDSPPGRTNCSLLSRASCDEGGGCQPQDSPPGRTNCCLISRVSCDEGGDCASCLPACLLGSAAESACCGLQTVSVSNLLGEGLPAWTCNSPSTQESWQCQTWGPTEPPKPSCQGQQLTAGPRRDRWCS